MKKDKKKWQVRVIFICLDDYYHFFERFYESAEKHFLPFNHDKKYYVFCEQEHDLFNKDNVTFCKVDKPMTTNGRGEPSADKREIKLNKFNYINQHWDKISCEASHVFYFDADSVIRRDIRWKDIWNKDKSIIGALHGFGHVRRGRGKKGIRFEQDEKSKAYVDPSTHDVSEYFQSCIWGGTVEKVEEMSLAIAEWIDHDKKIGHRNKHNICDEIYVNKFFVENKGQLNILGPEYCNPGEAYSRRRGVELSKKWGDVIISHECSAQNNTVKYVIVDKEKEKTHERIDEHRLLGWGRAVDSHKANYEAIKSFRVYNPNGHLFLTSYGEEDFQYLAERFNGSYEYIKDSIFSGVSGKDRMTNCGDVLAYLRSLTQVCYRYKDIVDWLVLLEDDVECYNAPKWVLKGASLAGPAGPEYSEQLTAFLKDKNKKNYCNRYSGCGGSILKINDWLDAYSKLDQDKWQEYVSMESKLSRAIDCATSFVLHNAGYNIARWDEFRGYKDRNKSEGAFAHGIKQFRKMSLSDEDLKDIYRNKDSAAFHVDNNDKWTTILIKKD